MRMYYFRLTNAQQRKFWFNRISFMLLAEKLRSINLLLKLKVLENYPGYIFY